MQSTTQSPPEPKASAPQNIALTHDAGLRSIERARQSAWRTTTYFLKRNHLALIGVIIILFWIIITITAPLITPYPPLAQNIVNRLQEPTLAHPFGTDQLGRDVLSRVMYGGRISIPAAVAVVIIAGSVGTIVGALAGFIGGITEEIFMRVTDVFMAFPTIILAMAVAAALGPSVLNAVIAITVVWWPNYARIVRGLVLSVKENEYVSASRVVGATEIYVLRKVVLPNSISPVMVMATLDLGAALLVFAGLSFLGLGAEPSTPEWGRMVSDGIAFFDQWWMSAFPGLAIFTIVMAFNFVGDGLRDALDPHLRRQI